MHAVRRVIIGWVLRLVCHPAPAVAYSPPWRRIDRDRWKDFLDSESGHRFLALLRAWEASVAILAVSDTRNTVHTAGTAKGYGDCIEHLIKLSWQAVDAEKPEKPKTDSEKVLDEMLGKA